LECAGIKGFAVMDDSRIAVFRDSAKDFEFYDPFKDTLEPAGTERFLQVLQESDAILVSASPNAKWTLTLEGNTLVVWNDIAAQRVQILSHKSGNITQAVFSPDSRFLVTAETGSETRLWRTDNWSSQVLCQPVPRTWGIGFSGDSRRVAISEHEGPIRVFDLTQGPLQNLEVTAGNTAYSVALSSSGSYLATGHQDDLIRIWSVETGEQIASLEGHIQGPSSLSFSPDDRTLASSNFATVKLWNVATWRELMSVEADVQRVQFSPDGRYLAALVTRAESDAFRGEGVGLRILKTPTLEEIDANSTMH
jgi:WD40 repeat protein